MRARMIFIYYAWSVVARATQSRKAVARYAGFEAMLIWRSLTPPLIVAAVKIIAGRAGGPLPEVARYEFQRQPGEPSAAPDRTQTRDG